MIVPQLNVQQDVLFIHCIGTIKRQVSRFVDEDWNLDPQVDQGFLTAIG